MFAKEDDFARGRYKPVSMGRLSVLFDDWLRHQRKSRRGPWLASDWGKWFGNRGEGGWDGNTCFYDRVF
jgi:hypothetical protein